MIISPNDTKAYRHITLDNGLDALLISDSKTDKSSAALAVNVGHFDDPIEYQGLAHLLEHMMFLGTKRFPEASEYHRFIKGHGGHHNAWTGSEHTNYYFAINNDYFDQALDRFSDFFINPLLAPQWIEKEINAVDSEYQLKYRDENRRFLSVLKEVANPQHPFAKFSVGNTQTFSNDQADIGEVLTTFYKQKYCASKMKVVLLSNLSLDQLEELAKHYFWNVPFRDLSVCYQDVPLYLNDAQAISIAIKPERDLKKLHLNFLMPHELINYHNKPLSYIGYLLGHEGEGSLLSQLKNLGLANALSSGTGLHGYNYTEFSISVSLTQKGLDDKDSIIALVFKQIKLIKQHGIEAWRYLEKHSLVKTAFDFQEATNPSSLTSHLATNMFRYSKQDTIYGDYSLDRYEPEAIDACLAQMTPARLRLITISLSETTNQESAWYDTPYQITPISKSKQQDWLAKSVDSALPELTLPSINPFIIERLSYRPSDSDTSVPNELMSKDGFRLWHMPESIFKVPKGHIYTAIDSQAVGNDARSIALCRLYVELLHDSLAELTYPAELAGMHYDIYPHQRGLTLHVSGFTPKLFLYFDMLIAKIRLRQYSTERFDEIKHQLITNWRNSEKAKPINRLFSQLSNALQPRQYAPEALRHEMETIEFEELMVFNKELFNCVHLESYVHGDWETHEIEIFADSIYHQISALARPMEPSTKELVSLTALGNQLLTVDSSHDDSGIIVYYQAQHASPTTTALYSLFSHLMSSFFFTKIRTEQQLGYLCGANYMPVNRHPGFILYIQSPVAGPAQLLEAIDNVVGEFKSYLEALEHQKWQDSVSGLLSQIATPDKTQQSAVQRFWIGIGNNDHSFSHQRNMLEAIENVTQIQLIEFIEQSMLCDKPDRLILNTIGNEVAKEQHLTSSTQINNLVEFKSRADKILL